MDLRKLHSRRASPAVVAIMLVLALPGASRGIRLPEHRFAAAEGLAAGAITDLTQDHRGFLWVGTEEGISRFDGVAFSAYGARDGLPYPGVDSIREDAAGRLWAGTHEGLCWLDLKQRGTRQRWHRIRMPGGSLANQIEVVRSDAKGDLWAAAPTHLYLHRPGVPVSEFGEVKLPSTDEDSPPLTINDLALGPGEVLWISTSRGLFRRLASGTIARVSFQDSVSNADPGTGMMAVAPNGDLWVNASGGRLLRIEGLVKLGRARSDDHDLRARAASIPPPSGHEMWRMSGLVVLKGALWVATPWGVCRVQHGASKCFSHGDLGYPPTVLSHDSVGNLWIGTESHGLIRLTDDGLTSYGPEDGLAASRAAQLLAGPRNEPCELVGNGNVSLACFDGYRFHSRALALPEGVKRASWGWNQILARDPSGGWWFGTFSGVIRYRQPVSLRDFAHPRNYRIITSSEGLPDNHVFRVAVDHRGRVWIGTINPNYRPGGLAVIDPVSGIARALPGASRILDHDAATALLDDRQGSMWVGTYRGQLLRYSFSTRTLERVPHWPPDAGLIWDLHLDRHHHRLWVATSSLGVVRVTNLDKPVPSFLAFGENRGLSSNRVRCIAQDQHGLLYLGLGNGVDRFDPGRGEVRHLGTADGLPNGIVVVCRADARGYLWFGTLDGLARLDPSKVRAKCKPRVELERFSSAGLRHAIDGSRAGALRLGPGDRDIEVGYSGACLAPGDNLRYQHRLIGLGDRWSRPSGSRLVSYAELAPGKYQFEVRAVNAEGETSAHAASLWFEIQPPWWRRDWFLATVAVLLGGLVYGGYRLRLARLLAAERLRTRIATDLHDELGSGLSRISILSEVVRRDIAGEGSRQRRRLDEIGRSARDLLDATSDMVWSIDPRRDDLGSLLARLRRFGADLFESAGVRWTLRAPKRAGEIPLRAEQRRHLLLILKEALNNALRHGAPDEVRVSFGLADGRRLVVEVLDDGCGFDQTEIAERTSSRLGYGLASMVERAHSLKGDLSIDSHPRKGTRVTLSIPLGRKRSQRGA